MTAHIVEDRTEGNCDAIEPIELFIPTTPTIQAQATPAEGGGA